jgi:hypothetical protein
MGTLFGQDFYSAVTTATTPEPVAHPPPPDAIAIIHGTASGVGLILEEKTTVSCCT